MHFLVSYNLLAFLKMKAKGGNVASYICNTHVPIIFLSFGKSSYFVVGVTVSDIPLQAKRN